jgi:hypothetical protein
MDLSLLSLWAVGSREMLNCTKLHSYTWGTKQVLYDNFQHTSLGFIRAWESLYNHEGQFFLGFGPDPVLDKAAQRKPQNLKPAEDSETVCLLLVEVSVHGTEYFANTILKYQISIFC